MEGQRNKTLRLEALHDMLAQNVTETHDFIPVPLSKMKIASHDSTTEEK
jgi:hypothetical protein